MPSSLCHLPFDVVAPQSIEDMRIEKHRNHQSTCLTVIGGDANMRAGMGACPYENIVLCTHKRPATGLQLIIHMHA